MITIFVRGLPPSATEESVTELFSQYGTVRSLKLNKDLFTGKARGICLIDMEGHEARAAMAGINQTDFEGSTIYASPDKGRKGARGRRR